MYCEIVWHCQIGVMWLIYCVCVWSVLKWSMLIFKGCCYQSLSPVWFFATPRMHARLLCPPLSLRACSNSCPLSQWCYLIISFSVTPVSFLPSIFPSIRDFSTELALCQRIGPSASVLPMNIQDWFPFGLTSLISLQSQGLWRVFSSTTVRMH